MSNPETIQPGPAKKVKTAKGATTPREEIAPGGKSKISWSVINFALDLVLFLVFVLLCWLAALTQFVFPSGATGASWRLLGGSVETWRNFQFAVLCVLAGGILIHVMLHWTWVCGIVESKFLARVGGKRVTSDDGKRTLVGVILLAATLLIVLAGLGVAAYSLQRVE